MVSPFSAEDAKGLLKSAVRDNDPGVTGHAVFMLTVLHCCSLEVDLLNSIMLNNNRKNIK